jgi:hypothetical protein
MVARSVILLLPIAAIATGQMVIRLVDGRLGAWGWAPAIGGYWLVLGIFIMIAPQFGGKLPTRTNDAP